MLRTAYRPLWPRGDSNSTSSKVDIFSRNDRGEGAGITFRHIKWQESLNDNLVSRTSSLLFAPVYIFHYTPT